MNKLLFLIYITALLLAGPAAANVPSSQIVELDYAVAIVNDDVLTRTELEDRIQVIEKQLREKRTKLPSREVLQKQIL